MLSYIVSIVIALMGLALGYFMFNGNGIYAFGYFMGAIVASIAFVIQYKLL